MPVTPNPSVPDPSSSNVCPSALPFPDPAHLSIEALTRQAESMLSSPDLADGPVDEQTLQRLQAVADEEGVGGPYTAQYPDAVGFTHFDTPASEDNSLVILLTRRNMERLPAQALVRILSRPDAECPDAASRDYLGVVVAGPFAEPDGIRADSSILITTTVSGRIFLPRYHGRAHIQILGEEVNGQLIPPRFRPRPNSPVYVLDDVETARILKLAGDARLGLLMGQDRIPISIPTDNKSVLPRHTGILGTTGGGKSTTVSRLVYELQKSGVATILIDVEGEYTELDHPTTDPIMLTALQRRSLAPAGVTDLRILHLVGRQTSRQSPGGHVHPFCLNFSRLSPHAVMEILDMPEAQQERFLKAYDAARAVLRDLRIFPANKDDESQLLALDDMEEGYPRMTISHLIDIASIIHHRVADDPGEPRIHTDLFRQQLQRIQTITNRVNTSHAHSWLGLIGRLGRINRLRVFDNPLAPPLRYAGLIQPGRVCVIDLSDTDEPQVRNLAIADILRGLQAEQEAAVAKAQSEGRRPTPVVVIIEEAHEFLSADRIRQMPVLFQQVSCIAKRGRKRWLGLCFVTQLPQHLPDEALGLINNWILHKITDAQVVDRLRKTITGLDRSQWSLIPGLAPGQALISLSSMARPLLASIDPTPCRLRLVE